MKKQPPLFFTIEVILFVLFIPVLINLLFLDYQIMHPFLMKKQPQSIHQALPTATPTQVPVATPTLTTKQASNSANVQPIKK